MKKYIVMILCSFLLVSGFAPIFSSVDVDDQNDNILSNDIKQSGDYSHLFFDGMDGSVKTGSPDNFSHQQFSISFYLRTDNLRETGTIVSKYDNGGFRIRQAWGRLEFWFTNSSDSNSIYAHDYDDISEELKWLPVVCSFENGEQRVYMDGELVESASYSGNITHDQDVNLTVGASPDLSVNFKGQVDDFRYYDYVLSESDVENLTTRYSDVGNPLLWWEMEEGSGDTLNDEAGNFEGDVKNAKWTTGMEYPYVAERRTMDLDNRYNGWEAGYQIGNPDLSTDFQNSSTGDFTLNYEDESNQSFGYVDGDGDYDGEKVARAKQVAGGNDELSKSVNLESSLSTNYATVKVSQSLNMTLATNGVTNSIVFDFGSEELSMNILSKEGGTSVTGSYVFEPSTIELSGSEGSIEFYTKFDIDSTSEYFDYLLSFDENNVYCAVGQQTKVVELSKLFGDSLSSDLEEVRFEAFSDSLGEVYIGEIKVWKNSMTDEDMKDNIEVLGKVSPNPYNKDISIAFDGHADGNKQLWSEPILEFLEKEGIRFNYGTFYDEQWYPASSIKENESYADFLLNYSEMEGSDTIRIGFHSVPAENRSGVIEAYEGFKNKTGYYPRFWNDHSSNDDNMMGEGLNESSEFYNADIVTENSTYIWVNDHSLYEHQGFSDRINEVVNVLPDGTNYSLYRSGDFPYTDALGLNYEWNHPHETENYPYTSINASQSVGSNRGRYLANFEDLNDLDRLGTADGMYNGHCYISDWMQTEIDGVIYSDWKGTKYNEWDDSGYSGWDKYNEADWQVADELKEGLLNIKDNFNVWWAYKGEQRKREILYNNIDLSIDRSAEEITVENNNDVAFENATLKLSKDVMLTDGTSEYYSPDYDYGRNRGSTPYLYKYFVGDLEEGTTIFDYTEDVTGKPKEMEDEQYAGVRIEDGEKYFLPATPTSNSTKDRGITIGDGGLYTGEEHSIKENDLFYTIDEFSEIHESDLNYNITEKIGDVEIDTGVTELETISYTDNWGSDEEILRWNETAETDSTVTYTIDTGVDNEDFALERLEDGEWVGVKTISVGSNGVLYFDTEEHSTNTLRILGMDDDTDDTDDSNDDTSSSEDDSSAVSILDLGLIALFIMILFSSIYLITNGGGTNRRK